VVTHSSYRHEALFYRDIDEFVELLMPWIRDGLEHDQPVMVAVAGDRLYALTAALGVAAARVSFVDMAKLGRNPANIIPAWLEFVAAHSAEGRPIRGIGELIWAARPHTELVESQLHEGLLNLAVSPDVPLWLICPYDVVALPEAVIREAHRSHPVLVESDSYRGSTSYGGAHYVRELFGTPFPEPEATIGTVHFTLADVSGVQEQVGAAAICVGVPPKRAGELAWTALQLATDSLWRAGGRGTVRYWNDSESFVVEISDEGVVADPLVGRRPAVDVPVERRSLERANAVSDLVQIRSGSLGTAVRVHTKRLASVGVGGG
jgi:hypothetical protein